MKQQTFSDVEYSGRKRKTKRKEGDTDFIRLFASKKMRKAQGSAAFTGIVPAF